MSPPEFTVHTVTSGAETFLTNAFLVETAESLVAVDTMMTTSDARALRRCAEAIGKPLKAVLITHGHPDHYNGTGELLKDLGKLPVIATASVERAMRRTDDAKELRWRPVFGDEWPKERVFPNQLVPDGETLVFDGIPFSVRELGPGESLSDLCWMVGTSSRAVFPGDLVFGGVHSFMNEGLIPDWLESLTLLEKNLSGSDILYTGHGKPGRPDDLIPFQRRYLLLYLETVRHLAGGKTFLSAGEKTNLVRTMKNLLPTDDLEGFIAAGADAVASGLSAGGD